MEPQLLIQRVANANTLPLPSPSTVVALLGVWGAMFGVVWVARQRVLRFLAIRQLGALLETHVNERLSVLPPQDMSPWKAEAAAKELGQVIADLIGAIDSVRAGAQLSGILMAGNSALVASLTKRQRRKLSRTLIPYLRRLDEAYYEICSRTQNTSLRAAARLHDKSKEPETVAAAS